MKPVKYSKTKHQPATNTRPNLEKIKKTIFELDLIETHILSRSLIKNRKEIKGKNDRQNTEGTFIKLSTQLICPLFY
jgi:hypothetical protein